MLDDPTVLGMSLVNNDLPSMEVPCLLGGVSEHRLRFPASIRPSPLALMEQEQQDGYCM